MMNRQPGSAPTDPDVHSQPEHEMVQAMTTPHASSAVQAKPHGSSLIGWLVGAVILLVIVGVAYWQGAATTPIP